MVSEISINPYIKAGTCPHGVPKSSCPICNRQSINHSSSKHYNKPQEWSYQKCYLTGLEIKAAKQHKENAKLFFDKQFLSSLNSDKNIPKFFDKIFSNIKFPKIQNIIQFLNINTFVNIFNKISKFQQNLFNLISHTGEKLVNILGEIKNFTDRKIIEDLKKTAKKFMSFCLFIIDDENYQNDETLAIYKSRELKKFLLKNTRK